MMELKNLQAKTSEEVAIETKVNKAVENIDNILLEIMLNSAVEINPFEVAVTIDKADEQAA